MTGKPLSHQKQAALWRAFKQRQTANFVATRCNISPHTAQKYILSLHFKQRLDKLLAKANEFVDEDQVQSLVNTLKPLANVRALLLNDLLAHIKKGELEATISDLDKIVRLERYLRGEPDTRIDQEVSFEWLEVDK